MPGEREVKWTMSAWEKVQDLFLTLAKRQEENSLLPEWAVLWGNRGLLPSECTKIRKPQCAIQVPVYLFSDAHKYRPVRKIYYFPLKKIHWHPPESYGFLNPSNTVGEPRVSSWAKSWASSPRSMVRGRILFLFSNYNPIEYTYKSSNWRTMLHAPYIRKGSYLTATLFL